VEYTYGNDLLSQNTAVETLTYLTDALGSTRGLVDANQNLTDRYNYTPYGKLKDHNGTSANNFLFTGEQFDSEVGNYYLRARYYSPDSGRFISRDSYDGTGNNPISQNHYLYGNGNPLTYVDPTGHFSMAGTMSAVNTMATLSTAFVFGYDLGDMFYGGGTPLPSLDEATAKQIAFAVMFSSAGGKILSRILGKRFKKLTKKRTLLRGVNKNGHKIEYADALKGKVNGNYFDLLKPSTYSSDMAFQHNSGNTHNTPFTSWTTSVKIAKNFATRGGGGGVVIRAKIMAFRIFKSPNIAFNTMGSEREWLVAGPVQGIATPVR
jgi:RHS repeat-associated protein